MSDAYDKNDQRKKDVELVDAFVEKLGEHFDCVQIFCSRHMPAELDGTITINRGAGNWCARFGQVREWVVYQDARICEQGRSDAAEKS